MISESTVEDAAVAWLRALVYAAVSGPDIVPGMPAACVEALPVATLFPEGVRVHAGRAWRTRGPGALPPRGIGGNHV
jgi:hypothetical protein